MLQINNLSLHFGSRTLFNQIQFKVSPSDLIGLTGKNGAGKSTLLKVIAGQQIPDTGTIDVPKNFKIGYLAQELNKPGEGTVLEETSKAFEEIVELEKQIIKWENELASREDYMADSYSQLITDLTEAQERFHNIGGIDMERQIERVLMGLGFSMSDLSRPIRELSGGWQMRIELAKILLSKPDVILLDEPTNHLDIESIIWVEEFLKSYTGAVILVSHDRRFLDAVTNRTVEIVMGKTHDYKCSYSEYMELRAQRREKLESEKKNQDKHIAHTQELINKFRAKKNKAAFAQSLIKKLDKMDIVEVEEEDISSLKIRFPEPPRSGVVVAEARKISKSYDDNLVLKDINIKLERGDKVAFVGRNGEGKSTLSNMMAGKLKPSSGDMTLGHNVAIGYFSQHTSDMLDPEITVLATLENAAGEMMQSKVRSILGAFLFSGEDVDKKVKVLSGGEKGRLAMAKLLLEPVNFLILDEPTNHLDMRSKAILKEAISNFKGTVIVVSHDREFLEKLSTKVYYFRNQGIKEYLGDVNYFLDSMGGSFHTAIEMKEKENKVKKEAKKEKSKSKFDFKEKKALQKEEKRIKNQLSKVEKEIADLENEIAEIDKNLADPSFFQTISDDANFFTEYENKKSSLNQAMESWEEIALRQEEVKNLLGDN